MTPRLFTDKKLCLATHNAGKLVEFQGLFADRGIEIVSSGALGLPEPDETGTTFSENALIKARAACEASGLPALADDSGLCVHALSDAPGLFSARWAGPARDFRVAMQRVHDALGDASDRSAHFTAALALVWPDGHAFVCEGRVDGAIVWPPMGDHGHGYDPIFQPAGQTRRFAEMTEAEKSTLSHRGRAVAALFAACFNGGAS